MGLYLWCLGAENRRVSQHCNKQLRGKDDSVTWNRKLNNSKNNDKEKVMKMVIFFLLGWTEI